ncbi:class I SAM-dependent methyltransferase [Haloarchaeobius iranensis]|uniref:Methyltransferase domain-containing protein n=1 Tax=Haloarchaeobius iranensis TaxID=996166 RepID=A0A1G9XLK5_9EURY|nr:class I SAM-dependent methyltransferase [Haloarchaeobius iranensis]SDM97648.1 Methyltransferase domain-containing protein [Haloarchaeobius iranensis]
MTEDRETLFLLWAARETGVLDALLSDADTPAEVAERTHVTERAARLTVAALADAGFFRDVGGVYEPTNRALGFLAAADLRSVGRFPAELDDLDALRQLPATMRGEDPPVGSNDERAPDGTASEWTRNRLGHVQATDEATVRACVTAAQHVVPDGRVVDIGGAPGTYAVEFARRGYDVTLLDAADRLDASASLLAREPVEAVTWNLPCDGADSSDLPVEGVDCAFVPLRTGERSAAANRRLVAGAADALGPGGWLVVVDYLRERSPAARAATVRRLALGSGEAHAPAAYRDWFEAAGLRAVQVRDVPGTDRQAVLGQARDS